MEKDLGKGRLYLCIYIYLHGGGMVVGLNTGIFARYMSNVVHMQVGAMRHLPFTFEEKWRKEQ